MCLPHVRGLFSSFFRVARNTPQIATDGPRWRTRLLSLFISPSSGQEKTRQPPKAAGIVCQSGGLFSSLFYVAASCLQMTTGGAIYYCRISGYLSSARVGLIIKMAQHDTRPAPTVLPSSSPSRVGQRPLRSASPSSRNGFVSQKTPLWFDRLDSIAGERNAELSGSFPGPSQIVDNFLHLRTFAAVHICTLSCGRGANPARGAHYDRYETD